MAFLFNVVAYDLAWASKISTVNPSASPALNKLNVDTFTLPLYLGRIKIREKGDPDTVVLHIQDAHCNYAAQAAISRIIDHLTRHYDISAINLEGGAKDYDLSIFTRIRDKKIRAAVSDDFLKEGLVSGAEYFVINNPEKATLWGVEDADLYVENLNIYRAFLKHKSVVDAHLNDLNLALNSLKMNIFSEKLLELDGRYTQYKAGSLDLKDYLSYLLDAAKSQGVDIKEFRNIYLLRASLAEEEKVDFDRANNERDVLVGLLQRTLSNSETEELILKTLEFKTEKISWEAFYSYLVKKAGSVNVDMSPYGELQKYITYISLYGQADKVKVIEEMDALEVKLKGLMYKNDDERELDLLSKNLSITKNLFNISLTKEDFKYYRKNEDSFRMSRYISFIGKRSVRIKKTILLGDSIKVLDLFRDDMAKFYECSLKRDQAFIKNIRYTEGKNKTALLVTGGFHTDNLSELFKGKNISYISIMPNYRNDKEIDCRYFDLLSGEMAGLEKRLYSVMSGGSVEAASISIAPILSRLIAMRVWGPDVINAFQAAVYLDSLLHSGISIRLYPPGLNETDDDVVIIGDEKGEVIDMTTEELSVLSGAIRSNKKHRNPAISEAGFLCGNCRKVVLPLKGGFRDHCTHCLWSRHLDDVKPGDRASECHGLMQPIGLEYNGRKGWMVQYRCTVCNAGTHNVTAEDDDWDAVVGLSQQPIQRYMDLKHTKVIEPVLAAPVWLTMHFIFGMGLVTLILGSITLLSILAHELAHKKALEKMGVKNTRLIFFMYKKLMPSFGIEYDSSELDKFPNWKRRKAVATIAGPVASIVTAAALIGLGTCFDGGFVTAFMGFAVISNILIATVGSLADYVSLYRLKNAKTPSEMAYEPAEGDRAAAVFDDDKCRALSDRIKDELKLEPDLPFTSEQHLLYGGQSYEKKIDRWGSVVWVLSGALPFDLHFMRIGHLFYVDAKKYRKLSKALRRELGNNVILVRDLKNSMLGKDSFNKFTMTTIITMINSGIEGKHAIDAGAGEGILSLTAAKLGARSVDLIENNERAISQARINFELNGYKEGSYYRIHQSDLRDPTRIVDELKNDIKTPAEGAILSNIGYWHYSANNRHSISLIKALENVVDITLFVGGGYELNTRAGLVEWTEEGELRLGERPAHRSAIIQDANRLVDSGFDLTPDRAAYLADRTEVVAWSASKKGTASSVEEAEQGEGRGTKAVTRQDIVSLVASSDSLWVGFMDMAKAGLRNAVCGRGAMDVVIEEVLEIVASELSRKYDGKVFKIGGDEIGFVFPPSMSRDDVHKALVEIQVELRNRFSDKKFLDQLIHRMRNEDVDAASIESFIDSSYVPFEPAGCVLLRGIQKRIAADKDEDRIEKADTLLTENMKYAETAQGYAKEEQGGLAELVKVIEDFSEPKKTEVSILTPEEADALEKARKTMEPLGMDIEEEYAALTRSSLWEAVNLAAIQADPAVYFARGPPDAFYVIRALGKGQVQIIKISSEYVALNRRTQRAFNRVLKDSGREPRKRDSDTIKYYGFKSPQDASRIYEDTGHERGNDWIKLLSLGIYETFTPSSYILTEREILAGLNQASRRLNSHTIVKNNMKLSFRAVFDASTANTYDLPPGSRWSIAGVLMPPIEQLDETRNSAIRSGVGKEGYVEKRDSSLGKTSPEVKTYKNNVTAWQDVLEENERARQARARRAREELIEADRKLNDSLTVILEQNGMTDMIPKEEEPEDLEEMSLESRNKRNLDRALKNLSDDRKQALKEKIEAAMEADADVDEMLEYMEETFPGIYYQGYGLADVASVVGGGRAAALVNINETGRAFIEDSSVKGGAILRSQGIAVNMVFNPHVNQKMYGTYYRTLFYDVAASRNIINQDQNLSLLRKHLGKQQDFQIKKDMSDQDIEKLMKLLLMSESPLQGLFLGYPARSVAMFMEPTTRANEGFGLNDLVEQVTGRKGALKPFTGFITSEEAIDESVDSAIASYKGWARCADMLRAMKHSYAREDPAPALKRAFEEKLAELKSRVGEKGFNFHEEYAKLVDTTIKRLSDAHGLTDSITIIAMGSYARRGCPYGTDLDIFLLEKEGADLKTGDVELFIQQAKNITGVGFDYPAYPYTVGGTPVAHFLSLSKYKKTFPEPDRISLRCLLDMRYVSGPREGFTDMRKLSKRAAKKLYTEYLEDDIRDLTKNAESTFDPNNFEIKTGRNGSRTINMVIWLGREKLGMGEWDWDRPEAAAELLDELAENGFLSEAEARALSDAKNFLLRLRTAVNIVWERPGHADAYEDGDLKNTITKDVTGEVADLMGMSEKDLRSEMIRHNRNVQNIMREFVNFEDEEAAYALENRTMLDEDDFDFGKAKVEFEIRNSKQLVEDGALRVMGISHGDLKEIKEYREGELDEYAKAFREGRIFAAVVNGEIAGYILVSRNGSSDVVIEELVVLPEYRDQDIGSALMDSAIGAFAVDSRFVSIAPIGDAGRFYEKYLLRRAAADTVTEARTWWLETATPDKPRHIKVKTHRQAGDKEPSDEVGGAQVPVEAMELYGTAKEAASLIVDILRKGSPTVVIEPAASLDEVSPVAGLFRKAEQRAGKKEHEITAESYLADNNWMANLRSVLEKVLPEFAAVGKDPKDRARMLIQLVAVDRTAAAVDEKELREFIEKFLIDGNYADAASAGNIIQRIKFSRMDMGRVRYSNPAIDLLRDIMMLEIDRYGREDGYPDDEVPQALGEIYLRLLRQSIANFDALSLESKKFTGEISDVRRVLRAIFEGYILQTKAIDWESIREWKRANDEVLTAL
ncbi:MAG: GNAT family N-acetyltransferase [Candidatus Omnitrophota bacterium]